MAVIIRIHFKHFITSQGKNGFDQWCATNADCRLSSKGGKHCCEML